LITPRSRRAEAAERRRRRDADPVGDRLVRHARVLGKDLEYPLVDVVEGRLWFLRHRLDRSAGC
jgi:hypothetical protein